MEAGKTYSAEYPLYTQGKLDPQAEAVLHRSAGTPPLSSLTPRQARASSLEAAWVGLPVDGVQMKTISIPSPALSIPLRLYTPEGKPPFPILVFFHGGGFVWGTLDEFDPFCSFIASGASCIVASVAYRLAPEHKHPAAVEDAVTAMNWVATYAHGFKGDPTRIAVAGDSAGGNLATVAAIIARSHGYPRLKQQVLICPWVDASSFETDSFRYFGDGLWLSKANMYWYRNHYLQNLEQSSLPSVSPLLTEDLRGLPPTLVITAEFDVLRDQGEAYAHRLEEADVPVRCSRYQGVLHDFVVLPGLFDQAKGAIDEICRTLRGAYEPFQGAA